MREMFSEPSIVNSATSFQVRSRPGTDSGRGGRSTHATVLRFHLFDTANFARTIDHDALVTQLEKRIQSLESELVAQSFFLTAAADLCSNISTTFAAGAASPEVALRFLSQREEDEERLAKLKRRSGTAFDDHSDLDNGPTPGSLSLEVRLAKPALQRSFALHLLDAFFDSCCSNLPIFRPFLIRKSHLYRQIDDLDPPSRVAVATFCALGVRATPHSGLLGIPEVDPSDSRAMIVSGVRREQTYKALHAEAMDLSDRLEIAHDPSQPALEALMVQMQALMWQELIPRRSRSMVRSALGMFKDLGEQRAALVKSIGLPLLAGDAITSAYGRRACLVTEADLSEYFSGLVLPDLKYDQLQSMIAVHLRPGEEPNHTQLSSASMIIWRWLIACQREFNRIASLRTVHYSMITSEIMMLWTALDQIHSAIQNFQSLLMGLRGLPPGCEADGCSSMHLRYVTRLDREVDDLTWLIHSLISERMQGHHGSHDDLSVEWLLESERRVRRGLKLAAFYFELYSISVSPNQTWYLCWQLELMPRWTSIAVQRYAEEGGPITPDDELTETELDWIEKGLRVAAYYHPVAERRLVEMQSMRRPPRRDSAPSRATQDRPDLLLEEAMRRTIMSTAMPFPTS
ncbi:BZ3500_MvSof-1268-A1-R1_Chr1-3g02176 [Microbotryum saponariae]|uniref:BZ3500_MvSof-1268-A1-R1_Chr1-3g02176 protein n=1 Tax=Microbotryum saponariae TaxID=289078 RepID=A0A2X0KRM6_9BASI|nr:BZ3500_MvSof-1268-A1-R1_Chr1-3g02176 [Microbotryum saponariae]SCZ95577.1 BZ3501_MvSof-1269-A2-R1_Chr1-3g01779 [Microbotryum saponariae]